VADRGYFDPETGNLRGNGTVSGMRQVEIKDFCLLPRMAEVLQNG